MKALTIWQPWVHGIVAGSKRIENRTWSPSLSIGERFALHAGAHAVDITDVQEFRSIALRAGGVRPCKVGDLPTSAIVGVATYNGFVTASDDPWFTGPIGWLLSDVITIDPLPCRGARGLWDLSDEMNAQVLTALGRPLGRR